MKIRTLIVDDMRLARRRLRQWLAGDPEIEIIGECANGREAIAAIKERVPDLVFLDVQMPEIGGFEVVAAIEAENLPTFVFVTGYDEFALGAFEVNAVDYLLKPVEKQRLTTALDRAKRDVRSRRAGEIDLRLQRFLELRVNEPEYLKRLAVKSVGHTIVLLVEDINWIGAAGNYVELHVGREIHLLRERLNHLELKLDPRRFVRIHRSTIVNVDSIRQLHPLFNGDQEILLRDGTRLTSSRTYHQRLKALIAGP